VIFRCDLIVIDGEHSLVGIQNDLDALLPYATPGTIIFIDDFNANVPMVLQAVAPFAADEKIVPLAHYQTMYLGSKGFVEAMVPSGSGSNL
jgi:predicted O-methyltransferase YrrM